MYNNIHAIKGNDKKQHQSKAHSFFKDIEFHVLQKQQYQCIPLGHKICPKSVPPMAMNDDFTRAIAADPY